MVFLSTSGAMAQVVIRFDSGLELRQFDNQTLMRTQLYCIPVNSSVLFKGLTILSRGADMKNVQAPAHVHQTWRDLVEAAIFETESENVSRRIQDAQDAVNGRDRGHVSDGMRF